MLPARRFLATFIPYLALGLIISRSFATPTLIAEDTFTYSAGSIVGANGGTGWSAAWFNPYSQSPLTINSSGQLIYSSTSTIEAAARAVNQRFSSSNYAQVYILFDVRFGTQSGGGTPNLRIYDSTLPSNQITGGLGNNGYGSPNYSILGAGLTVGADSGTSLNTAANILYEIDYTQNQSRLWVGSISWNINALPTSGANATLASAPAFDRLDLYVRQLAYFDNLSIYAVAIPEPAATATLMGVCLFTLVVNRRPRRA